MKTPKLAMLRFFSLLFLLPGFAGLIASAIISTHYMATMPKSPAPEQMRMTPRGIHGVAVYQTVEEDRKLSLIENSSVGFFVIGMALGLVYLEKWGSARSLASEQDDEPKQSPS
jgi:hypothetical protein